MDILKHQVFGNTLDKWVKKSKMNKVFGFFFIFFAATSVLHIAKLSKLTTNEEKQFPSTFDNIGP